MITPELKQYVADARATGMTDAKIKESLLALGWGVEDVDGVLGPVAGSVPVVQTSPQPPEGIVAPRQVFNPMAQTQPNIVVKESHTGLIVAVAIIFLLIIGCLVALFYYRDFLFIKKEVTTAPSENFMPIYDNENTSTSSPEQDTTSVLDAGLAPDVILKGNDDFISTPGLACMFEPTGLVAWYPGDGNAIDIKNANNGFPKGGVKGGAFSSGIVGQAFSFNGYNEYVQAPVSTTTDPTTSGSLGAWVKFNKLPSESSHIMQIIGRGGDGTDFDLQADQYNKFRFYIGTGKNVSSKTIIEVDKWYYVMGAWDAKSGLKMYINGVLENTNDVLTARKPSGQKLEIGSHPVFGGRYFNGLIDEVEVYNRAVSASEISSIFQAGSAGKCKTTMDTTTP